MWKKKKVIINKTKKRVVEQIKINDYEFSDELTLYYENDILTKQMRNDRKRIMQYHFEPYCANQMTYYFSYQILVLRLVYRTARATQ